jgi:LPS-assembly protein
MKGRRARALGFACLLAFGAALPSRAQTAPSPAPAAPAPPEDPVPAPPADAATAVLPPVAAPAADRITFEVKFADEQGGGKASGSAGTIDYEREDLAVATGGVELQYQDITVHAERVSVDLAKKEVEAQGGVVLDQGPRRLAGDTLTFDLETKTGTIENASAFVNPDYYFRGKQVAKIGDDTYTVTDGVFTSCAGDSPPWSFKVSSARVEVEEYAHVRNATLRVQKVPVFYLPYVLWPVKSERTAGLLIPNLGYNRTRGSYIGFAYFQPLGRSYDTTLFADLYGKEYHGLGDEFRYRPSEDVRGMFQGYVIKDPVLDEYRWKVLFDHESKNLFGNMRGVVSYRDFSDFEFFRDFERGLNEATLRTLYSQAFLTGSWGPQSLNILVDDRQTFITSDSIIRQQQLPEIEYRVRQTKIGRTPLYFQLQSSANYFSVERSATYDGSYGRADLFPELSLPLRAAPWMSLSISGGGRATWYGDSTDLGGQSLSGETLTRIVPTAGAEVVGPSFSRIFSTATAKWKHVIEPRWNYAFLGDFDDTERVPLFDEVDLAQPANLGRFALVNRLLWKPAGEDDKQGAREILSLELSQAYSFDSKQPLQVSGLETEAWGPLQAQLRWAPSDLTNVRAQLAYNTLANGLDSTALSGTVGLGRGNNLGMTWFTRYNATTGDTLSDQISLSANVSFLRHIQLLGQVNYDLENSLLQQDRLVLAYNAQCWGFRVEYREFRAADRHDRDYRFALSLKNVGTFLDLTGGSGAQGYR